MKTAAANTYFRAWFQTQKSRIMPVRTAAAVSSSRKNTPGDQCALQRVPWPYMVLTGGKSLNNLIPTGTKVPYFQYGGQLGDSVQQIGFAAASSGRNITGTKGQPLSSVVLRGGFFIASGRVTSKSAATSAKGALRLGGIHFQGRSGQQTSAAPRLTAPDHASVLAGR